LSFLLFTVRGGEKKRVNRAPSYLVRSPPGGLSIFRGKRSAKRKEKEIIFARERKKKNYSFLLRDGKPDGGGGQYLIY